MPRPRQNDADIRGDRSTPAMTSSMLTDAKTRDDCGTQVPRYTNRIHLFHGQGARWPQASKGISHTKEFPHTLALRFQCLLDHSSRSKNLMKYKIIGSVTKSCWS